MSHKGQTMTTDGCGIDPVRLFGDYMNVTGVPTLAPADGPDPKLYGKKLGVVNGASWVSLWSAYFGRLMLPTVQIINVGNEAIQLKFMEAHRQGRPCPPQINIDLFCRYARDLFDLMKVDAILISCSTMNRAFRQVSEHMKDVGVPVVQIDEAMMEQAVKSCCARPPSGSASASTSSARRSRRPSTCSAGARSSSTTKPSPAPSARPRPPNTSTSWSWPSCPCRCSVSLISTRSLSSGSRSSTAVKPASPAPARSSRQPPPKAHAAQANTGSAAGPGRATSPPTPNRHGCGRSMGAGSDPFWALSFRPEANRPRPGHPERSRGACPEPDSGLWPRTKGAQCPQRDGHKARWDAGRTPRNHQKRTDR